MGKNPNESIGLLLTEENDNGITTTTYPLNQYPDTYPAIVMGNCTYNGRTCYEGNISISRLNLNNQIVSGTFDVTVAEKGCDTLRMTDG